MQTDDFHVFDTTLRDGAQREGISYSVADKLAVARLLDQLGVGFIEGGWPGAMPKDTEFFARAADGELVVEERHAGRVRRDAQGRRRGRGRPAGARVARLPRTRGHARREVVGVARARCAAHHARGEPRDGARHGGVPARRGTPRLRRLRALLRRVPARPGLRRPAARHRRRGRRGCRRPVRHQRRHAAVRSARGRHRCRLAGRHPARHPHPGRHGLRCGEHLRGGGSRRDTRPGHRKRLWRARREREHLQRPRRTRHEDGTRRPAGRVPRGDGARIARDRRDRQSRTGHPCAVRRRGGVRAQGRPARVRYQGRAGDVQPPRPLCRRQRPADPRDGDGRPRVGRTEVRGTRGRCDVETGRRRKGRRTGQAARGRGLVLRGGGRVVRAVAARRAGARSPLRSPSSRTASSSTGARTARW